MRVHQVFLFCLLLVITSATSAQQPGPSADTLLLVNANVIDGAGGPLIPNASILVRNGKIETISPGSVAAPAGASVMDLKGKYVMPGLIDGHVHVATTGQARSMLMAGVTTARSMGAGNYSDIGLRELAKAGRIPSPEILAVGYHVRPDPDTNFFINEPSMADMMVSGVRGTEGVTRMVGALLERGVNFIKVNATERAGTPETDPRKQLYSEAELRAIVEMAAQRNIPVAAHAHGDEGALAAVKAGVRSIEHGTYLSDATIALMKEKGTYFAPTLAVVADLMTPGGQYQAAALEIRGRHMYPRIRETTARAHKAGVKVIAATDGSYTNDSTLRLAHEIEELVGAGLTAGQAIQAATSVPAVLLGVDKRTGVLKPGMEADLIATERNPLTDVRALQDILLVVNNGRIALNRLAF